MKKDVDYKSCLHILLHTLILLHVAFTIGDSQITMLHVAFTMGDSQITMLHVVFTMHDSQITMLHSISLKHYPDLLCKKVISSAAVKVRAKQKTHFLLNFESS